MVGHLSGPINMLLISWIIGIASFTLLGSWYARKYNKPDLLIGLYVTFVLVAQILAAKISVFDLGFKTFYGPSGVLVFSITYLLTDIVNEKFGRKETQKIWTMQTAWENIFNLVPRITLASWIAFLISENFDAFVYSWFKKLTHAKHLWMRNVFSSIPSLLLDSLIFIPIAFLGIVPLIPLIVGQTAIKWLVGLINIPFMYLNKYILKENE
ncbi:MAG: Conserved hypothetical integral membrane protein [Parcubacteria group bacterium GW2011_GWC1_39_29]|nr:MAG: Conserved hypothetical integral membrane protein [Parcubacteria group bacterium GW2011_GWC1_39_29]